MSLKARIERCWVIRNGDGGRHDIGGDYERHDSNGEAAQELADDLNADLAEDEKPANLRASQLPAPCIIASCNDCGYVFDTEADGGIVHFEDIDAVLVDLRDADWAIDSDKAFCVNCACAHVGHDRTYSNAGRCSRCWKTITPPNPEGTP